MRWLAVAAWFLAGCVGDLVEPWQLDHDRIVAVRAEPAGVEAGERAVLASLLAFAAGPTEERAPDLATVVSPPELADVLVLEAGTWSVTAPDEARLAATRGALGIAPDLPVPLVVGVSHAGGTLLAIKTIYLGERRANPAIASATLDGALLSELDPLVLDRDRETHVAVDVAEDDDVQWLTSAGELHDDDLPRAYLTFDPDEPTAGELALVVRDERGGVTWEVWRFETRTAASSRR